MSDSQKGSCFCGAVRFEISGEPLAIGYCHCASCRGWLAAPVYAFTMWPADAVTVTAGGDRVATFLRTPDTISHRQFCTTCGSAVMIRHPSLEAIDVPAANLPGMAFVPAFHVNYGETVHRMRDGLPKMKGFPEDFGGTGELVPE